MYIFTIVHRHSPHASIRRVCVVYIYIPINFYIHSDSTIIRELEISFAGSIKYIKYTTGNV